MLTSFSFVSHPPQHSLRVIIAKSDVIMRALLLVLTLAAPSRGQLDSIASVLKAMRDPEMRSDINALLKDVLSDPVKMREAMQESVRLDSLKQVSAELTAGDRAQEYERRQLARPECQRPNSTAAVSEGDIGITFERLLHDFPQYLSLIHI